MATVKVTALTETTSPQATDVLLISQSGVSKKVQITNLPVGTPADDSITYAKIQNVSATDRILGRDSAGAGDVEEITVANVLTMLNVEAGADVTDATNVTAAGALMDSELAGIAAVKATTGTFLTADQSKLDGIAASANNYVHPNHSGDVTSTADGATVIGNDKVITAKILDDNVTAAKLANSINTDIATGVTANTTANAALPKAGGTMTGDLILGDGIKLEVGSAAGGDLQIYHDGSNSYIVDSGTGSMLIRGTEMNLGNADGSKTYLNAESGGALFLRHNGGTKLTTTSTGVTVTGGAVGTMTTDNDGSFAMSASNNFKCTPAGNFALTFTAIVAQSGNILFINSGGHTISAHANTKVDANLLATISTAGTYLLAYFSDGTNVYMTNSAAYA